MKNIKKTLQILLIITVAFYFNANFVIAEEGPGASTSEESDQTSSTEEGPGASNSTEQDQNSSNNEGPGASNSNESDQTGSNTEIPDSSSSNPSDQDSNVSYDALSGSCSVDSSNVNVGDSVNWTVEVTGGNDIYSYDWSGDDGISGTSKIISHTYNIVGNFSATVEVSSPAFDENGNINLNCGSVEVSETQSNTTTTSSSGSSNRRTSSRTNSSNEEEVPVEEELTEEDVVEFLSTLTPQETAGSGDSIENQVVVLDQATSVENTLQDTDETGSEQENLASIENNQLAAIGNLNFDWLNTKTSIASIIAILALLGISYFTFKKNKANKNSK